MNGTFKRYFVMSLGGTLDSGTLGVPVYPQCQSQAQATVYRSLVFFAHKNFFFLHKKKIFPPQKKFFPQGDFRDRGRSRAIATFSCVRSRQFLRDRAIAIACDRGLMARDRHHTVSIRNDFHWTHPLFQMENANNFLTPLCKCWLNWSRGAQAKGNDRKTMSKRTR